MIISLAYGVEFKVNGFESPLKLDELTINMKNNLNLFDLIFENGTTCFFFLTDIKPILRPFAEFAMVEEIMDEFNLFDLETIHNSFYGAGTRSLNCLDRINLTQAQLMFKHHIDVFGLIDRELAYDVNKLNNKKI